MMLRQSSSQLEKTLNPCLTLYTKIPNVSNLNVKVLKEIWENYFIISESRGLLNCELYTKSHKRKIDTFIYICIYKYTKVLLQKPL